MAGGPPEGDDPTARVPPRSAREPPDAPAIERGAIVGRYRILGLLGQGGMGSVYEAYDPQLDRRLALKLVRAGMISDPYLRARLAREARTMAKLSHPNVVTVFDAGTFGDDFFIAMELVPGETLREWLKGGRSRDAILRHFAAAGRGLAAAHAAGIVHRDFKPDNVLVDREGRVAVTDFGVAAPPPREAPPEIDGSVPTSARAVTEAGTLMGTPRYMSPEQYAGDKLDGRSDQFSFAVALYEALFHQRPFPGETIGALLEAVRDGRVRDAPADTNVPPHVTRAVLRALSTDPADRFPTLTDMIAALEAAPTAQPPPPRAAPPHASRAVAAAAAALTLVMAAGVGLAIKLRKPRAVVAVAPSAAPVEPSRRPGGRTPVLVTAIDDAAGDPRFTEAIDMTLAEPFYASRRFDPYTSDQFAWLEGELRLPRDPGGQSIARALVARDGGAAIVVRATVVRAPAGFHLHVTAEDGATGRHVLEVDRDAPDAADMIPRAVAAAQAIRTALGDPPTEGASDRIALSSSLDAVHDWAVGTRLVRGGQAREGVLALRRAVAADPSFALARGGLAIALFDVGDNPEAAKQDRIALEGVAELGDRRRLKLLADYYDATGRYAESIAAYEQLLTAWPGDWPTETSMAATAIDASEWPLAMELSRRAVRDHPGAVVARQNLVLSELAGGALEDAARDGEATLAAFPHPPVFTFEHLAAAEVLLGRREEARATLDKLALVDPEAADETRADVAVYEGRLSDAEALLDGQIRAAKARDAAAFDSRSEHVSLALIHLQRGEMAKAVAETDRALAPDADVSGPIGYVLARLLLETGREAAATALTRGWEDGGLDLRMYATVLKGDVLRAHGKRREAIAAYRDAGRVLDGWPIHERLGQAYLDDGAWADADRELSACVARRGEGAMTNTPSLRVLSPVYFALARAKEGEKDPGAKAAYEAFLAIEAEAQGDPLVDEAKRRLARLEK